MGQLRSRVAADADSDANVYANTVKGGANAANQAVDDNTSMDHGCIPHDF